LTVLSPFSGNVTKKMGTIIIKSDQWRHQVVTFRLLVFPIAFSTRFFAIQINTHDSSVALYPLTAEHMFSGVCWNKKHIYSRAIKRLDRKLERHTADESAKARSGAKNQRSARVEKDFEPLIRQTTFASNKRHSQNVAPPQSIGKGNW
jgi:hypothetical protein